MITKEDFEKRIEELCSLKEGWLDGVGGTYNKESFNNIKEKIYDANDRLSIPIPFLFPAFESDTVQVWWWDDPEVNDLDIYVNLNTNKIVYISIEGMDEEEFDFDEQWDFILNYLWEGIR